MTVWLRQWQPHSPTKMPTRRTRKAESRHTWRNVTVSKTFTVHRYDGFNTIYIYIWMWMRRAGVTIHQLQNITFFYQSAYDMPKEIQRGYRYNSLIVALFHIIEMYEIKHQMPEDHFIKTAFFPFQGCSEALQEWLFSVCRRRGRLTGQSTTPTHPVISQRSIIRWSSMRRVAAPHWAVRLTRIWYSPVMITG